MGYFTVLKKEYSMADAVGFRDIQYINVQDTFNNENENGETECVICLEKLKLADTVRELGCKHIFHKDCVENEDRCPLCREPISSREVSSLPSSDLPIQPQHHMHMPSVPPVSVHRDEHFAFGTTTRTGIPSLFPTLEATSTDTPEEGTFREPDSTFSRRTTSQRATRNSRYQRIRNLSVDTRRSVLQQPSQEDKDFAREIRSKYETLRKEHDRGLTEAEKKEHEEANRQRVLGERERA